MVDDKERIEIKRWIEELNEGIVPDNNSVRALQYMMKVFKLTDRLSFINKSINKISKKEHLSYDDRLMMEEFYLQLSENTPYLNQDELVKITKAFRDDMKKQVKDKFSGKTKVIGKLLRRLRQ